MSPLRILFLAAEADPFVKVGGLGDVAGSLPQALKAQGFDVRIVLPFHTNLRVDGLTLNRATVFTIPRTGAKQPVQVTETEIHGLPVYLIAGDPIDRTASVYSPNAAVDGEKYIFFSLAALELARRLEWQPDIIHANDWHTAPAVYALRHFKDHGDSFFARTQSILSIHNLGYMGAGAADALHAYGLPPVKEPLFPTWASEVPLPQGLWGADRLVAVSPTYAQEILTPEFGYGLETFLTSRSPILSGIINGIDYRLWDPSTDEALLHSFDASRLDARLANKAALQARFGLAADASIPLMAMVTRFDYQKGVDVALDALRQVTDIPWQAVFLGTGSFDLESAARRLESDFPSRFCAVMRFDAGLSRQIYAGSDVILMPSRYEPCGLTQMIAMRYGSLPLARTVGGLRDTIADGQTGFLYSGATPGELGTAIRRVVKEYAHPDHWKAMQARAMLQDFSWERSAQQYAELYRGLHEVPA